MDASWGTHNQPEFGSITEQYRPELRAHCYRLMGSLHDAEDMVQETLLRAWRHRGHLQVSSALRAWLYKIATNVCLDALRQRKRRFVPHTYQEASTLDMPIGADVNEPIWVEPYPDHLLPADSPDPEQHIATREHIALAFITATQLLPPRQRAILLLSDVLDFSVGEVAQLLDTTASAVKSALHRARSTLAVQGYTSKLDAPLIDMLTQTRLADYVRAWENADIHGLITLLREDATFSMPPIPSWYRGRETIGGLVARTVFAGPAAGRWRMLPTAANHQPAFGLYRLQEAMHRAYGIQVLTVREGLIADIITFRKPSLVARFGLPSTVCDVK